MSGADENVSHLHLQRRIRPNSSFTHVDVDPEVASAIVEFASQNPQWDWRRVWTHVGYIHPGVTRDAVRTVLANMGDAR